MPKLFLSLVTLLLLVGCATSVPREGPTIYFSNASSEPIKKVECVWAGKNKLTLDGMNPGDNRGQSFFINKNSEFFGEVFISWHDSKGERMTKNFDFKEGNLPSISDHTLYSYVQFYFTEDGVEVVSSDAVDVNGKSRIMERLMAKNRSNYLIYHPEQQTSLIRVQQQ